MMSASSSASPSSPGKKTAVVGGKKAAPVSNVHMNVLGMDGADHVVVIADHYNKKPPAPARKENNGNDNIDIERSNSNDHEREDEMVITTDFTRYSSCGSMDEDELDEKPLAAKKKPPPDEDSMSTTASSGSRQRRRQIIAPSQQQQQQQQATGRSGSRSPNNENSNSASGNHQTKKNWLGSMLWGGKKQQQQHPQRRRHEHKHSDLPDDDHYESLAAPMGDGTYEIQPPKQRRGFSKNDASQQSQLHLPDNDVITEECNSNTSCALPSELTPTSDALAPPTTATVEDQLKQGCTFFYQGVEQPPKNNNNGNLPTSRLADSLGHVPRLFTSAQGAAFYAKYERLNQDMTVYPARKPFFARRHQHTPIPRNNEVVNDNNLEDLFLDEGDVGDAAVAATTTSTPVATVDIQTTSSLFYEQDGKLLMRLPRDQVRLVMAQDLEPGIVSVEQWRRAEHEETSSSSSQQHQKQPGDGSAPAWLESRESSSSAPPDPHAIPGGQPHEPLKYVLTVPDDLYRRVVAEMSYQLIPPYCGMFRCCQGESEFADIRIAWIILTVILVLLFITTLEYKEE